MSDGTRRRDFVRALALGGASGLVAVPAAADDEKGEDKPRTEADARFDLVVARFGKHLDADARKAVRSEVEALVRRAEALRTFPLDNGDGPMPIFGAYRRPLE